MRRILLGILFLVATPLALFAQTLRMVPDSGIQGESLPVTIVGDGTNFRASGNISAVDVQLNRSGTTYARATYWHIVNDSTIDATLPITATMLGNYDLEVAILVDYSATIYKQASAFTVLAAPPSIYSVTPSSANDSQTIALKITGLNTNFESGPLPTVSFQQNGHTYFSANADTVYSNTSLGVRVTIPGASTVPTGIYDVIVENGTYSDTGKQKFTILGPAPPMPGITLSPDSGAASTAFEVTIVGQGTNFGPSLNVSILAPLDISLNQNGTTFYQTTADTVFTTTLAHAVFKLPAAIPPGIYDAEVYYDGTSYRWDTTFLVTPHPIINVAPTSASIADTVTMNLTGSGVNFIYEGTQYVKTVQLLQGKTKLTASNIAVTSDTSLSAFFAIPTSAPAGFYNIAITEPGTNRIVTAPRAFSVDTIIVRPDTASQGDTVYAIFTGIGGQIDSMYFRNGSNILRAVTAPTLPLGYPIFIFVPPDAQPGHYDFILFPSDTSQGDSIIAPNAFTVEAPAGVTDNNSFSGEINSLRVSPNPTQDNLTISFALSAPTHVRLRLFDALGRTVGTLCDRTLGAGTQNFEWSAKNVPAGSYFYELTAGEEIHGESVIVRH